MTVKEFKDLVLSFPGTEEKPHFDRTAFKVIDKRIFATLHEASESANILLPVRDQEVFCAMSKGIYPVPNKWGEHGWTTFELKKITYAMALDALDTAYKEVLKSKAKKKK
jgi:predicted DNA-binding protein (MmcQ/YjbR family)